MRRPLWQRTLAGIWLLWFTVVLSGPPALHACPAHSGHVGAHPAHSSQHANHAEHAGSHSARAQFSGGVSDSPPSAPGSAHQDCTCLGSCCGVRLAVLPLAPSVPTGSVVTEHVAIANVVVSARAARPRYSQPFANGPPTVMVVQAAL